MGDGRARDVIAGAGLSVGLLALGVCLSGNSARALSYATESAGPAGLQALPGSVGRAGELSINGTPTRVRVCKTDQSAASVLDRYRALAASESGDRPWVESDDDQGGYTAWVSPDGLRKAVRVASGPTGGCEYELLEADPPGTQTQRLPADLPLPAGCRAAFSMVREDGTGTALLLAQGSPAFAIGTCLDALRAQGFQVDERTAAALEGEVGPRSVPFTAPGRRGLLMATPTSGGARISISIHQG